MLPEVPWFRPLAFIQRATHLGGTGSTSLGYGSDGAGRDARLSGVKEHDAARERGGNVIAELDLLDVYRGLGRIGGEQERAAESGGVVILESAGDTELFHFGTAAPLGERRSAERSAGECGQGAGERDAGRR